MPRPTLEEILAEADPLGLLESPTSKEANGARKNDPTAETKADLDAFLQRRQRLPEQASPDLLEARLARRAQALGLLAPPDRDAAPEPPCPAIPWRDVPPAQGTADLSEIAADPLLATPGGGEDLDIADLGDLTPATERTTADYAAKREPCPEFDGIFKSRFEAIRNALRAGHRQTSPFRKPAGSRGTETMEGDYYQVGGMLAYVAEKSERFLRDDRRDHRLRVVYENGTESDILMSSFEKSLWDDPAALRIGRPGLGPLDPEWNDDVAPVTGTIYVVRTLSTDPAVAPLASSIVKIGVTGGRLDRRIASARRDPTFLMAPVEVVGKHVLHGVDRKKLEGVLHAFFAPALAQVAVRIGGRTLAPQEWFYAHPDHVEEVVKAIKAGTLHELRYDPNRMEIVSR